MVTKNIKLLSCNDISFERLICFKEEVANPQMMKNKLNQLIWRLDRHKIKHRHRVITKVLRHYKERKTILMQIMVPLVVQANPDSFMADYDGEYFFLRGYNLGESIKISIANDMNDFKSAVEAFVRYKNMNNVSDLDFKNNHIIEIAKIDTNGMILGFDLHMEKRKAENQDVND